MAGGVRNVIAPHDVRRRDLEAGVRAEAGAGPGEKILDEGVVDRALVLEHAQDFVAAQLLDCLLRGDVRYRNEHAVRTEHAPRNEQVNVRVPVEQVAGGLQARDAAGEPRPAASSGTAFFGLVRGRRQSPLDPRRPVVHPGPVVAAEVEDAASFRGGCPASC